MVECTLQRVPTGDFPELVQVLKKTLHTCLPVLGAIQQCMKNNEVINGCVFVDKWPSFNVVVFEKYQKYAQRADTTVPPVTIFAKCSTEKLKDIIQESSDLQSLYKNPAEFHGSDIRCAEIIQELGAPFGFCSQVRVKPCVCALTDCKHLVKFECPPGYRLGPLALKDANFVNRLWKHGTDRTLKRIKASIKSLLTAGIYTVTTNELVAWALQMDYGAIGNLQTLEGHQHQGLAKSLISHLTCEIVKGDMVPYCLIEESNVISKKLFQKMGFTLFPDTFVSWIDVVPM